jgi:hypothetical protein
MAFFGDEGVGGFGLAAGVEASGRQPEISPMTWHSLAVDQPCEFRVSLGGEARATHAGGGSQPEKRAGLAAEVHMIDHRRRNPVRGVFEYTFSYPACFAERRLDQRV